MGQIRYGIKSGGSGSGSGSSTPPTAGGSNLFAGFGSGHISLPGPLLSVEIYNAGFTDGSAAGDVPGPVDMFLGTNPVTIEVGQKIRFEAVLDPVNNIFYYIPEIEINVSGSSSSMIEYSYQTL